MHRLFVGLRPPPEMRMQLLDAMGGIHNARWQSAEQLHCTLRYIGEVDHDTAEDVAAALGSVHFPPLDLALDGVGSFDKRGRINAVWAGLRPHDAVTRLHHKVEQALARIGLAPETRAFLPHITLARLNAQSGPIDRFLIDQAGLASPPARFEHFLLFESTLGREGAQYEAIARYPLTG